MTKGTYALRNDITFLWFKNVNRIYAELSDFYAASPSLRASIKQQMLLSRVARLILFFKMNKRTYALRGGFLTFTLVIIATARAFLTLLIL